jgi:hypothetical protein
MAKLITAVICAALFGLVASPMDAVAQQKSAKACREEWRANRTANQADGITERAYVARCRNATAKSSLPAPTPPVTKGQKTAKQCRDEWRANRAANVAGGVTERAYVNQCRAGGTTAAAPGTTPVAAPATEASERGSRRGSGQKTVNECRDEWRAKRAANEANGVTERAYVDQCRAGGAAAERSTVPAAPSVATPSPSEAPPARTTATAPVERPAARPRPAPEAATANEFSSEAEAKARCPSDTVVWASLRSKIYHFSGTRYYANTEHGPYMCEGDSTAAGMRAARNERHP